MSYLTVALISGYTFFLGALILIAGSAIPRPERKTLLSRIGDILLIAGFALEAVASQPLPVAYFIFELALLIAYGVIGRLKKGKLSGVLLLLRVLLILVTVVAIGSLIYAYHVPPITWNYNERLYIIGDSLSAGLEEDEVTWPEILEDRTGQNVVNLAAAGATVRTAMHQAAELPDDAKLILLEIGGNDLLGGSTVEEFEEGLEDLLASVAAPERRLVMFELPLPPFRGGFARVQHRLAAKYGVTLIPRRVLADAFLGKDATTDGLHLSHSGHEQLAEHVLPIFKKNSL